MGAGKLNCSRSARSARALALSLALRLALLFTVLLIAAQSLAAQGDRYRCRYSGRVMDARCCKARLATSYAGSGSPEARPADCCETLRGSARAPVPGVAPSQRDAHEDLAAAYAPGSTLLLVPEAIPSPSASHVTRRADLARAGPTIFLRDCRFLS